MWMSLLLPLQLLAVSFRSIHATVSTPLSTDEHGDYNGADLIEWIRSHPEGDIHQSVRVGRERPGDPTSIIGLFVANDAKPIEKGDIIAQIPWDHLIHPGGKYKKFKFFSCRSIYNLAKELRLGDKSKRAPYVRYLLSQPRGIMPGEWTKPGQAFLARVLGDGDLPPYEDSWRTHFRAEWINKCEGNEDDDMEAAAYWLAASRDEDTLMVPIYDMANHSNDPDKLNTLSYKPDAAGGVFKFVASRAIRPGEEIYNCYNRCNQCSDVPSDDCETWSYSRTPDLFAHFGFVEEYPQNWELDPAHLDSEDSSDDDTAFEFCLHRDDDSGSLEAYWEEEDMPDAGDAKWLGKQLRRLRRLNDQKDELETELVAKEGEDGGGDKMTRWEWDSTWRYHQALSHAINAAIQSVVTEDEHGDEL